MLGGEVIERQQVGSVFDQAFRRPVVFHAVGFGEVVECGIRSGPR